MIKRPSKIRVSQSGASLPGAVDRIQDTTDRTIGALVTKANGPLSPTTPAGGTQPNAIYQGAGLPAASIGLVGDFYFRTDSGTQQLYTRTANGWVLANSLLFDPNTIATNPATQLIQAISVVQFNAGALAMVKGNRAAADPAADVLIASQATRTAGSILAVQNNGVNEFLVDFLGNALATASVVASGGWLYSRHATPTVLTDNANATLRLMGNRAAADAGADILTTGQATRTAGLLLDVQNNGTSKVRWYFDGTQEFPAGVAAVRAAAGTNTTLNLWGARSAADAGADVIMMSQATRTAGNILLVQNNGTNEFIVDFSGNIFATASVVASGGALYSRGATPAALTDNANASMTVKGNRNAADAGTDVILTSTVTRTAGWLAAIVNNGTTRFNFDFPGDFGLTTAGTASVIYQQTANGGLTLRGNKSAADTGTDVIVNTVATRTAGNLLDVQNAGTSKFHVDVTGSAIAQGWFFTRHATPTILTDNANTGLRIMGNNNAGATGGDVAITSQVTRTAGSILDVQNNGTNLFRFMTSGATSGNFEMDAAAPVVYAAPANATLGLQGNRNAADTGTDIQLNAAQARTAGHIVDVTSSGTTKAYVASSGIIGAPNVPQNSGDFTSDVTTSLTTFTGGLGLSFAVKASTDYFAEFFLVAAGSGTAFMNAQITGPASPTAVAIGGQYIAGTSPIGFGATAFSTTFQATGTSATKVITVIRLHLRNGVNAGTVDFTFASQTAGQTVTLGIGSFVRWQRMDNGGLP